MLREQQALQAHLGAAEQAAAAHRAQALVSQGWGALEDWLNHPEGAFVKPKDPMEYHQKLRFHQSATGRAAYGL